MQEVNLIGKLSTGGSYVPVIEPKTITENGTYSAPEGVDGYNPINVRVSGGEAVIEPKTITENGTYSAPEGVDGYSPVTVQVAPLLEDKYINENGLYGPSEGYDGIRSVNVDVPIPSIVPLTITENGTYESSGGSGFNPITVNVPSIGNVIVNKFPIVNNRTLQPVPCNLSQGKYYAMYYYDDYLYPRSGTPYRLGCTAFARTSSGTTVDRFYLYYANITKDWYCTDTSIYLNTKIDNDTVNAFITIIEIDESIINNLLPS